MDGYGEEVNVGNRHREHGYKRKSHNRFIWGIAAAVILLLLAGAVYWVFLREPDQAGGEDSAARPRGTVHEDTGNEENGGSDDAENAGEAGAETAGRDAEVKQILDSLTLEEKVCQLFMITPEALTGVETVIQAGAATQEAIDAYPVGGVIYFAQNLKNPDQTKTMLANTQQYATDRLGFPVFLSVDEEGGQVARVGNNSAFGVTSFGNMSDVGSRADTEEAYEIGSTIGAYLKDLGFNMDAAPDTDVLTNSANEVVKYRSFGSDPKIVTELAAAELKGLNEQGIIGMYKHFPGHGGTTADSHEGYAYVDETLEELKEAALVPFQNGIDSGIRVIMVSHIACPNVTGDNTPATLSKELITDVLRNDMGFDGMVITDALNMGAVTQQYSSAQAAVAALDAGADMLLMPEDFKAAYQGVLDAVNNGTISEERINESVRRILEIKVGMQI